MAMNLDGFVDFGKFSFIFPYKFGGGRLELRKTHLKYSVVLNSFVFIVSYTTGMGS